MFDPVTIAIGSATLASALATPLALSRACRATTEYVRLRKSPIGEALEAAFGGSAGEPLPDDMRDMLARLD
jgi:hypothetical protein